jgi:DNA-binding transcriptional LysR family regulator
MWQRKAVSHGLPQWSRVALTPRQADADLDMEISWLEDFLAVVGTGSFSRAAEMRHITQSALSRRIQSLEEWVGTPLFERTTHAVKLRPAGLSFRTDAEQIIRSIETARREAKEIGVNAAATLRFAATNALSLGFFPTWLRGLETLTPEPFSIQLVANHMQACEQIMVQGHAQFLLCHFHPAAPTCLTPDQFRSERVGDDVLIPVSVPDTDNPKEPKFPLSVSGDSTSVPYLAYRPESGIGRIVHAVHGHAFKRSSLQTTFTSHSVKLLVTMTLDGRGMAWLPKSLIEDHLQAGSLVPSCDEAWIIPIQVHLLRPRARQSPAAESFWEVVLSKQK